MSAQPHTVLLSPPSLAALWHVSHLPSVDTISHQTQLDKLKGNHMGALMALEKVSCDNTWLLLVHGHVGNHESLPGNEQLLQKSAVTTLKEIQRNLFQQGNEAFPSSVR